MSSRMLLSVEDAAAGLSALGTRQDFTFSSARALRVAFSSAIVLHLAYPSVCL